MATIVLASKEESMAIIVLPLLPYHLHITTFIPQGYFINQIIHI